MTVPSTIEDRKERSGAKTFEDRLNRLEHENRRLKQVGALAVLVVTGALLIGPTSPETRENRAERFQLIDPAGKTRATLGMTAEGPELSLYDANDRSRVSMGATRDGSRIRMFDAQGRVRTRLVAGPKGTELALIDTTGISRVGLIVTEGASGSSMLDLRDRSGKTRAELEVEQSRPEFRLYGDAGKVEARLRVWSTEGPELALFDTRGKLRGSLAVTEDGWPGITLWDGSNSRAAFGLNANGPRLLLADSTLDRRATLDVTSSHMGLKFSTGGRRDVPLIWLGQYPHEHALRLYDPSGTGMKEAYLMTLANGKPDFWYKK